MKFSAALVALSATLASALPQIEVKGNQFYFSGNGSEFKIRGLAYQPGGQSAFKGDGDDKHDPLSIPEICKRDAPVIQSLGANVVRVYNLHPDLNHDECVSVFEQAGIYLMLDVNSPEVNAHINKDEPWTTYHKGYLKTIFSIVDAFKGYNNVIAFFSGNEIIDTKKQAAQNPPYIRAVIRDLRRYIKNHSSRFIAVGYAGTDTRSSSGAGADSVTDLWNYLRCSDDEEKGDYSRSDFFAVNIYSWCADADYKASGYPELVEDFNTTSLPVFWSEHGCNVKPRQFNEIPAMYDTEPDLVETFAGGLVFEYSQEPNNFGLVVIDEDDNSVTLREDFHSLQKQYNSVNWDKIYAIKEDSFLVNEAPKCKDIQIKGKDFGGDFSKVPEYPEDADDLMKNGSGNTNRGKLLTKLDTSHSYKIFDGKKDVTSDFTFSRSGDAGKGDLSANNGNGGADDEDEGGDDEGAAGSVAVGVAAILAPMVAGFFYI
jgi:hypothetical protein